MDRTTPRGSTQKVTQYYTCRHSNNMVIPQSDFTLIYVTMTPVVPTENTVLILNLLIGARIDLLNHFKAAINISVDEGVRKTWDIGSGQG